LGAIVGTNLVKAAVAEAIGTFALIFIGVLAVSAGAFVQAPSGFVNLMSIATAHGLTILAMVAIFSAVSGGHFNPAITAGFVATGRMPVTTGAVYWLAQLIGASLAALLLVPILGTALVGLGTPALGPGVSVASGIIVEAIGTFFLILAVFGTAVDGRAPRNIFPIVIGLTIAFDIMAFGPLTGGAVNPARAFGPALASGHWSNQLVYWIGPIVGGVLAALVEHHFFIGRGPVAVEEHGGPTIEEERGRAA
jgi:MIP family channel proteins